MHRLDLQYAMEDDDSVGFCRWIARKGTVHLGQMLLLVTS
jgi:hypothetical protein